MGAPVVAYILRMFPQASETFVANEILALQRLGVPLRVFSYRRPVEEVRHECIRLIEAPVSYLPDPVWRHLPTFVAAHRALHGLDPARYRRTLRYVLAHSIRARDLQVWKRFLQAGLLARLLRNSDVEHLHAHFAHGATHVAMLAGMLSGLKFSFTAHARDIYTARLRLLKEKIAAAELVITCTRANQEHLRQLVEPGQRPKVQLVYHGVDLAKFSPAKATPPSDTPLILSVGRLVGKKGFPHLLRACRALKDKGLAFRCVIVGEGSLRPALTKVIRALDLQDTVSLPGAKSQEELVEDYRRATVLALPCRVLKDGDRDGIPNVLVEAMALGLPVVSTPVSGIPELVQSGHNGLLIAEGDEHALAAALELLIGDASLRERLGRNARSTVEARFDATASAQRLAALLREACLGRPADEAPQGAASAPREAVQRLDARGR